MKRIVFFLVVFLSVSELALAQTSGDLERVPLKILDAYCRVEQGQFQIKEVRISQTEYNYSYFYIVSNESSNYDNAYYYDAVNKSGRPLINQKCGLRPFRTGPNLEECVFVLKNYEKDMSEIGFGTEMVFAMGAPQIFCDSVISVFDEGFVYKQKNRYFYSTYRGAEEAKVTPIVWLEKKVFNVSENLSCLGENDKNRLSDGDVYYESEGINDILSQELLPHYYYLYRDDYMPYTVLVIDGDYIELFGVYSDENFRLKYSYNGKHWMAVGDDRFWVDGEMKSAEGYAITDFLINDNGEYIYKASKIGTENRGEVVVQNGQVIIRNAYVGYFQLNAEQKLKFHFLSRGQWLVYEDGVIDSDSRKKLLMVSYVDDMIENMTVRIIEEDLPRLSYVVGKKGVIINGIRLTESVPFQVVVDKVNNCFRWNAIETKPDGKIELVVYKYHYKK